MENKTLSRALFFVSVLLFIITAYFVWGMMSNGAPDSYDPDQMGVELIDQGLATNANYAEEGKKAYENKISQIEGNILAGVNYMTIILFLAGGLMVVFLLWGLIKTLRTDFKKGIPSLIFVGIVILALIWASLNSGSDTEGFYQVKDIFFRDFLIKDYLWPISQNEILRNPNLVQSPGW